MGKLTTAGMESSSLVWDNLEELVRLKVREFIQALLEDEVRSCSVAASPSGARRWMIGRCTGMAMARSGS